ncbi:hypothetical protein FS749_004222 [Ceratobasidium sp. UAMH 11750]|nr:hypothetical protein FS749_004222 [Ceratobasidium sp. UAMH 11750]
MFVVARPSTTRCSSESAILTRSIPNTPTKDAPKQGVLRLKTNKENVTPPSGLPRLSAKRGAVQPGIPVRKVSGSQPTLGAAALRNQVDTLRAENAKLRKEHQRELAKLQEKSAQSEVRVQELVREKLARESEYGEIEREQRVASQREAALRTALERSETALKQLGERSGKLNGAERKLEDLERIHADEKRRLALDISSLQSQLDVARITLISHTSRLRERDSSKRLAHDLELRLQERDARILELEDQAQLYERRVQVYDDRVRAYKERVRVAEERAKEAEGEVELVLGEEAQGDTKGTEELEYTKQLVEKFALAYGKLYERMMEREQEIREMRRALKGKARMVEVLEEDLKMAGEETTELTEEVRARRLERRAEVEESRWEGGSRAQVDELVVLVREGQNEIRRLESLAFDLGPPRAESSTLLHPGPSPGPSASRSASLEAELAQLRTECAALREDQESLEQDLVDAAMASEEHARQAAEHSRLQIEYASLQAELKHVRAQSSRPSSAFSQLEAEHKRLAEEYESYKAKMEGVALSLAEHEARAVLLNGSQAREQALRDQIENLRGQIAKLGKALAEECASTKKVKERVVELQGVEEGLRGDMNEMMEALDRVDRYEEAYESLVAEVVQLGLGEDELDRLQNMTEKILGTSTAKQKMRYVEEVKMELDQMAQKLVRAEWERDQARKEGVDLRRELDVFQRMGFARSASTPPVSLRSMPMMAETLGTGVHAEMRALGLGLPPRRPGSASSANSQQQRRISRALSYAIEAEGVVPSLVEEEQ